MFDVLHDDILEYLFFVFLDWQALATVDQAWCNRKAQSGYLKWIKAKRHVVVASKGNKNCFKFTNEFAMDC